MRLLKESERFISVRAAAAQNPPQTFRVRDTVREITSKIDRRHGGMPFTPADLAEAARGPGASFLRRSFDECRRVHGTGASAAARGQDRLDGVLPGLPRRCAARSAEAAHAAASS